MTLKTAVTLTITGLCIGIVLGIPQFFSSIVRIVKLVRYTPAIDVFVLAEVLRVPSVFITQVFLLLFFISYYKKVK